MKEKLITAEEFLKEHRYRNRFKDYTNGDLFFLQALKEFAKLEKSRWCKEQRKICMHEYQFDCNDRVIPYEQKQLDIIENAPEPK